MLELFVQQGLEASKVQGKVDISVSGFAYLYIHMYTTVDSILYVSFAGMYVHMLLLVNYNQYNIFM